MDAQNIVFNYFPNQCFIGIADAAIFIGQDPKTARNQLSSGKFPLQTIKIGGKRLVPVPELIRFVAKYLSDLPIEAEVSKPAIPRRSPGRPRKLEGGAA